MVKGLLSRVRGSVLLLSTVLCLFVGLVFFAGRFAQKQAQATQIARVQHEAEIYTLGLNSAVERFNYLPYAAAKQPEIVALMSNPKLQDKANSYLEELNNKAGSSVLYVLNTHGMTVASSNWQSKQSFVGNLYPERPYFIDAMHNNSGLFHGVGKTTGIAGVFISTAIKQGDKTIGVAVAKVDLERIRNIWFNATEPVILTDSRGIVFLSSEPEWLYKTTRALSPEDLRWIKDSSQYPPEAKFEPLPWRYDKREDGSVVVTTQLHGKPKKFFVRESRVSELGWHLFVTSNYQVVAKARDQVLLVSALLALIVGMLVLFSWNRELRKEQEFRKAMEKALRVGMRARDMRGRVIYVNPALCKILGYSENELIGRLPPYPYWKPGELDRHWRDNDAAMSGRAAKEGFESCVRHKDGHDVYTMVYTAPLMSAGGKQLGWMSSVVDITAQKKAQEKLQDHEERLQRASRAANVGEMASTLAHELNQPLMALDAYADAAKTLALTANNEQLNKVLEDLQKQVRRSGTIVNRILTWVRQKTPGIVACDLVSLIQDTLEFLKPSIRKWQTSVNVNHKSPLALMQLDRTLIEQVLVNLLMNAMQSMQNLAVPDRCVNLTTEVQGNCVKVSVLDQGPWIAPEDAERMFTPFFTTKPDGLGLGLNICRTIIEKHGGTIFYENHPAGGTTFSFTLPWPS